MPRSMAQSAAISARSVWPTSNTLFMPRFGCCFEQVQTIGLGLTKKSEGIGKIVDGQPRLFGKTLRREIVGIAPRRRTADLDQPLLDAALKVGVDQTERDAEFGGKQPLRLRAILLHRVEQSEHDPRAFRSFFAHATHMRGSPRGLWYAVHRVNVKTSRSNRERRRYRFLVKITNYFNMLYVHGH